MVAAVASSMVFGLVPALRSAAPDLHHTLKQGGRSSGTAPSDRVRQSLVVVEVALSADRQTSTFERIVDGWPSFPACNPPR